MVVGGDRVNIEKPDNEWTIQLTMKNKECPYLCFPADYWGCKHPDHPDRSDSNPIPKCDYDKCPLKLSPQDVLADVRADRFESYFKDAGGDSHDNNKTN